MKLPGQALLELKLEPQGNNLTELQIVARFLPRGLAGIIYWQVHYLPHEWLYRGMLTALARDTGHPPASPPQAFTPTESTTCKLR